jgi:hypothetical protein
LTCGRAEADQRLGGLSYLVDGRLGEEDSTMASSAARSRARFTGLDPIFQDAADFDLELIESRALDGNIQELIYRPHPTVAGCCWRQSLALAGRSGACPDTRP